MSENHFKAREKKQPPQEQPVVVKAPPRKVDVICTATGDGGYYAVPQTEAGVEFCSAFYYRPLEYKDIYKTMMYPLEVSYSMQAHFRVAVAASGLNVVFKD